MPWSVCGLALDCAGLSRSPDTNLGLGASRGLASDLLRFLATLSGVMRSGFGTTAREAV